MFWKERWYYDKTLQVAYKDMSEWSELYTGISSKITRPVVDHSSIYVVVGRGFWEIPTSVALVSSSPNSRVLTVANCSARIRWADTEKRIIKTCNCTSVVNVIEPSSGKMWWSNIFVTCTRKYPILVRIVNLLITAQALYTDILEHTIDTHRTRYS